VGALQPEHLLLILVIVLILFGAGKLPETFKDIGRGVRSFREEADGKSSAASAPAAAPAVPSPSTVTCASCGKSTTAGQKFCMNCGKAL